MNRMSACVAMERWLTERDEEILQPLVAREIRDLGVRGPFLDIGSGTGLWVAMVREAGEEAYGLELSVTLAGVAKRRYGLGTLVVGDGVSLPFRDGSFCFVHLQEVIEHVNRAGGAALLGAIRRGLRRGGKLRLTTPNRLMYAAPSRRPLRSLMGLLGQPSDRAHIHEYWPWELRRLVERTGFEIVSFGFRVSNRYIAWKAFSAGLEIIAVKE